MKIVKAAQILLVFAFICIYAPINADNEKGSSRNWVILVHESYEGDDISIDEIRDAFLNRSDKLSNPVFYYKKNLKENKALYEVSSEFLDSLQIDYGYAKTTPEVYQGKQIGRIYRQLPNFTRFKATWQSVLTFVRKEKKSITFFHKKFVENLKKENKLKGIKVLKVINKKGDNKK